MGEKRVLVLNDFNSVALMQLKDIHLILLFCKNLACDTNLSHNGFTLSSCIDSK